MTPRAAVRLAWGLWGLALALIVAALAVNTVQVTAGEEGILAVLSLVFITTGAFLAGRRPANPVGWLLLGWGMVMALGSFTGAYVNRGLVRDPGSLPGPSWVGWAEGVIWHPAFGLLALLLLLFPHGRLPSPRWRPFAWFVVAVYLVLALAAALAPGSVELYYPEATPPVRLPVAGLADAVFEWLLPGQLLVLATALVSLVLRLRRASGEERQQVKWFVYTVVTVVLVTVVLPWAVGLPNPLLWGVLAGVLNYVPYLGPAIVTGTLGVVGLLTFPTLGEAVVAPAIFLAIVSIEGQFLTPALMGRRLELNPFAVFLAIAFCTWLWGPVGAFVAVPLLIALTVTLGHALADDKPDLPD